jgi:hypothetical protein
VQGAQHSIGSPQGACKACARAQHSTQVPMCSRHQQRPRAAASRIARPWALVEVRNTTTTGHACVHQPSAMHATCPNLTLKAQHTYTDSTQQLKQHSMCGTHPNEHTTNPSTSHKMHCMPDCHVTYHSARLKRMSITTPTAQQRQQPRPATTPGSLSSHCLRRSSPQ